MYIEMTKEPGSYRRYHMIEINPNLYKSARIVMSSVVELDNMGEDSDPIFFYLDVNLNPNAWLISYRNANSIYTC